MLSIFIVPLRGFPPKRTPVLIRKRTVFGAWRRSALIDITRARTAQAFLSVSDRSSAAGQHLFLLFLPSSFYGSIWSLARSGRGVCLLLARSLCSSVRMDCPLSSVRCVLWIRRSGMASARMGFRERLVPGVHREFGGWVEEALHLNGAKLSSRRSRPTALQRRNTGVFHGGRLASAAV